MANLQGEILSIQEYFRGIEYFGKGIVVKVMFPEKWSVYPSRDGIIKVSSDDTTQNLYYYYTDLSVGNLDDIFSLLHETIKMNLEAAKRVELLKVKMNELKELFANNPLEKLATLQFMFVDDATEKTNKPKRKYTRKKKEAAVAEEENKEEKEVIENAE